MSGGGEGSTRSLTLANESSKPTNNRQFIDEIPQTDATSTISMLSHCVCYLNSAINPIIYNYMNSEHQPD